MFKNQTTAAGHGQIGLYKPVAIVEDLRVPEAPLTVSSVGRMTALTIVRIKKRNWPSAVRPISDLHREREIGISLVQRQRH
jgi:hypothetical protein